MEEYAVTKLREYLRINTEHPTPDYYACQEFLFKLADDHGFERSAYEMVPGKPFVVMTIEGTHPQEPSLMLYSHTDVVPCAREHWTHDPFSAFKDEEGRIFARGTQDMKSIGIAYVEALRRHALRGKKQFRRTIHIVWGPEEELGGLEGMKLFADSEHFERLNIGFTLDEGIPAEDGVILVHYAERAPCKVDITFEGNPGHASKFIANTALEKMNRFITLALAFRAEQEAKLKADPSLVLGDVTTLNITVINGGLQTNVVPSSFVATMDVRITPSQEKQAMDVRIADWCKQAGEGVHFQYRHTKHKTFPPSTPCTREDKWWAAVEDVLIEKGLKFKKDIFCASTDSFFVRAKGIRAVGISPIKGVPMLLHDHNEFITERAFLDAIDVYESLVERLADMK